MESFWTYIKRNGLMVWIANLLGQLTVSAVFIILYAIVVAIGLVSILGATAYSFYSLSSFESLLNLGNTNFSIGMLIFLSLFAIIMFLLAIGLMGFQTAGSYAVANETFKKERVRISTFFVQGFRYTWKTTQLFLWMFLLEIPIFLLLGISIALFVYAETVSIIFGVLLVIISVLLFLGLGLSLIYAPLLIIAEQLRPWQAIKHSFQIFRQNIGKIILVMLLIWGTVFAFTIVLMIGSLILFLPISFSLLDPTGILASIIMIVIYVIQWTLSIAVAPLLTALIGLIIAYFYYKYFRPRLFPENDEYVTNPEPTFTFKSNE